MSRSTLLAASVLGVSVLPASSHAQAVPAELIWAAIDSVSEDASGGTEPGSAYGTETARGRLIATGLRMIRASIAAYELSDDGRARAAARAQYEVREFLEREADTQALLLEDDHTFVVAVRGSQENRDWVLDLTQASVAGVPGIKVHVGFNAAAVALFDLVNDAASGALLRGKTVWVTGHSLGGAVAELLAYKLHDDGVRIAGVHTFGSPAVGTALFAQDYDKKLGTITHRWVNDADPMPCYPALQQAWEQVGRQHVISAGGIALDSSSHICEDAFPTVSKICEGGGWWGEALRWATGAAGICESTEPAVGLLNLVQNVATNEFSAHRSAKYERAIADELSKE